MQAVSLVFIQEIVFLRRLFFTVLLCVY